MICNPRELFSPSVKASLSISQCRNFCAKINLIAIWLQSSLLELFHKFLHAVRLLFTSLRQHWMFTKMSFNDWLFDSIFKYKILLSIHFNFLSKTWQHRDKISYPVLFWFNEISAFRYIPTSHCQSNFPISISKYDIPCILILCSISIYSLSSPF